MRRVVPSPLGFEVIEAILRDKPKRQFFIFHPLAYGLYCRCIRCSLGVSKAGRGGFCIVWMDKPCETREAFIADLPQAMYDLWEPGDRKIAQLELVVILQALVCRPHRFHERRGVWFIECGSSATWRSL